MYNLAIRNVLVFVFSVSLFDSKTIDSLGDLEEKYQQVSVVA